MPTNTIKYLGVQLKVDLHLNTYLLKLDFCHYRTLCTRFVLLLLESDKIAYVYSWVEIKKKIVSLKKFHNNFKFQYIMT